MPDRLKGGSEARRHRDTPRLASLGRADPLNLRLPVDTLSRLHRYRDYLNQTQPGIDANVSMAARMLLFRALDQVEEEMGIRKKAKGGLRDLLRGKK